MKRTFFKPKSRSDNNNNRRLQVKLFPTVSHLRTKVSLLRITQSHDTRVGDEDVEMTD